MQEIIQPNSKMRVGAIISYKYLLMIALLLNSSIGYSQIITGDSLVITISPISDSLKSIKYQLHIDAYLDITDNSADSLVFTNSVKFPATELMANNLEATRESDDGYAILESCLYPYSPLQKLVVKTGSDRVDFKLRLSYDILGTSWAFYLNAHEEGTAPVRAFHADYENLFPECDERIVYQSIQVVNPVEGATMFHNLDNSKKGEFVTSDLNITVVDDSIYVKEDYKSGNIAYSIYYMDSLGYLEHNKRSEAFENALLKLAANDSSSYTFDVVSASWNDAKGRVAFGKTFHHYIFCDTTFLREDKSLLHEILHVLYPISLKPGSKAKHFIYESLIEWLTQHLYYGETDHHLSAFNYSSLGVNLYYEEINNHSSWDSIYNYGPFIIQEFALANDPSVFFKSMIKFLISHRDKKIDYDDFISFLKEKGYSPHSISTLDNNVKGNR